MKNKSKLYPFLALAAVPAVSCSTSEGGDSTRPNIIYIMSDDHTSQGIGAYGGRLAHLNPTPTIDRIANEGIIMNNAFCTNSISTPSRGCIITGQYSQTSGVLDLDSELPVESQYLPQEMSKLGYQTAIVGKWHLKNQPEMFDYYNVFYGQGDYFDPILCEKGTTEMAIDKKGEEVLGHKYIGHSSDIVMDATLNWLENKRDKSKPFFLCHQFKAPHDLFNFNPRYKDYLEDVYIPEPASMWEDEESGSDGTRGYKGSLRDTIGSSVGKRNVVRNMGMHMKIDPTLSDREYKHQAYQEYLKRYLRCVKGVDDNVKRLFDYLEAEGLMDNTIIIYTGDQGFFLGEHDFIDKRWMYDEAMRMPFLVRYPAKIKAGSSSDALVNNVDFAETIIDMAGGKAPDYMQGMSFKDILYNEGREPEGWRQSTYYRYWMHMAHRHNNPAHFGVRTKDYKLIFFYGVDYTRRELDKWGSENSYMQTPASWELYDLRKDPDEMRNVYADEAYTDVVRELKAELKRLREELNETDENYPHIQEIIDEYWDI